MCVCVAMTVDKLLTDNNNDQKKRIEIIKKMMNSWIYVDDNGWKLYINTPINNNNKSNQHTLLCVLILQSLICECGLSFTFIYVWMSVYI